ATKALLATRTVSSGGMKVFSALEIEKTLSQSRKAVMHSAQPWSICCCIIVVISGAARLRAKSAHASSLKCLTSTSVGGRTPESNGGHSCLFLDSVDKGPGKVKKYS